MKKLNILFLMSLLISSMDQLSASNDASQQEQVVQSQVDATNEEFPRLSTEQYVYAISTVEQPAEPGLVIAPEIVSDKTIGNYFNDGKTRTLITQETKDDKLIITTETWKTANPSYMTWRNGALVAGAVSVVALSYMMVCKIQGDLAAVRLYAEDAWKDNLSDFKNQKEDSSEKRLELLEVMFLNNTAKFSGIPTKDLNADVAHSLTKHTSKEEFTNFVEKLNEHVRNKNGLLMHLGDVAHVLDEMKVQDKISEDDFNKTMQFFQESPDKNGHKPYVFNLADAFLEKGVLSNSDKHNKLEAAYHEAGHALVGALYENEPILYATIIENEDNIGHIAESSKSLSEQVFGYKDLENYRKEIKVQLAGGIAMSLLEGKERRPYKQFRYESSFEYGMGNRDYAGSDMYKVYKNAESYYLYSNPLSWLSPNADHQGKVNMIVQECYEEVYDVLDAHQEQLAELGNKLYKNEILSSNYIYDVANSTKPESNALAKYFGF